MSALSVAGAADGVLRVGTVSPMPVRGRGVALAAVCVALFVVSVDNTIVNVALPSLAADLGSSTSALQWVVDAYVLVFAGLLLAFGSFADRVGRRRVLAGGLVVVLAASVVAVWASSADLVVLSRAVQGVGAAAVMPATLAVIVNVFPDAPERARAVAVWAATVGLAVAVGPVLGGFLVSWFSWHAVFTVNVPLVALALVGLRWVPESRDDSVGPVDWWGAVLSVSALSATVFAIVSAAHAPVPAVFTACWALVSWVSFVTVELRSPHPMLQLSLFRNARFSAACLSETCSTFGLFGCLFLFTQYLQFVLGLDAWLAGLVTLPVAVAMIVGSVAAPRVAERFSPRSAVALSQLTIAVALVFGALFSPSTPLVQIVVAFAVIGAGMGVAMTVATDSIMGAVGVDAAGVGSAMNDATREVGGALGVAVLGALTSLLYRDRLDDVAAELSVADSVLVSAKESLFSAVDAGGLLAAHAKVAFTDAMTVAFLVAAVAAVAAAVCGLWLPSRAESGAANAGGGSAVSGSAGR